MCIIHVLHTYMYMYMWPPQLMKCRDAKDEALPQVVYVLVHSATLLHTLYTALNRVARDIADREVPHGILDSQ